MNTTLSRSLGLKEAYSLLFSCELDKEYRYWRTIVIGLFAAVIVVSLLFF